MQNRRRRVFIVAAFLVVAAAIGIVPLRHELGKQHERVGSGAARVSGIADDVSRLNATPVNEIWPIPGDEAAAEPALRELLKHAQAAGLHVSVSGARHSMGGQTIAPGGMRVDMLPLKSTKLDGHSGLLHVDAGALWADVNPYLDRHGRSVEVMQSDNSFTVGGSLSVNCHGWQYGRGPIASTVESFHLMKADGTVVRCSRTENNELFSLALGGYGLFGVILDADLRVVKNERMRLEQVVVPLDNAMASFERKLRDHGTPQMVYARLNVTPERMFDDVLINIFYPVQGAIPELTDPKLQALESDLSRLSWQRLW